MRSFSSATVSSDSVCVILQAFTFELQQVNPTQMETATQRGRQKVSGKKGGTVLGLNISLSMFVLLLSFTAEGLNVIHDKSSCHFTGS